MGWIRVLDVEFTDGDAPPQYDNWKRYYSGKTGPGMAFGAVTGIGTQGFWHSEVYGDLVTNTIYDVCVLDGNVSAHVTLDFSRERGVSAVGRDDLEPIAEAEARKALNGLREN